MNPSRFQQIEQLYYSALDREPAKRPEFLRQACGDDAELRREVESLLAQLSENPSAENPPDTTVTQLRQGTYLGPYRIEGLLGAGGMGEVFRATDTRLGRQVAVKTFRKQFNARFEREAKAIASLNHPNVCTLFDVGPDFLVMELVEGETLAARLKQGPLSADDSVRYGLQIASALDAAHAKGIIHRDIKPGNIMLAATGVKVLDFGLAKAEGGQDVLYTGANVVGTPPYMSPEQAEGNPLDRRSDIFSFGAVFYEMLSGRRAFAGNTVAQVLSAVLRDEPPKPDAPEPLVSITFRCLHKSPALRYQSIMELRTELDAALEKMIAKPAAAEPSHQPSIAVLPFATMSSDKEQEYFSDGLAEEIGNALARIPGLKVTARTSAFAFRGKEQDIRKIAEALDVRTILEGSVRRSGNRIRVNVQLVQAVDGYRLWSERYDREFADVFEVQDEIAEAITAALKVKFEPAGVRRPTANLDAYEALLKARHFRARLTQESLTKAREYLEQAIALDPNYELAHCELAQYFIDRALYADEMPAHTAMPAARVAAQRTLEINPSNPEAHAALGAIAALYDYDWKAAGHHFNRALAHEPVPPQVYFRHGLFYLLPMGRPAEAAQELARGLKEDPLNIPGRVDYAVSLQAAGRAEESVAQLRQIQALDPNFWFPYFLLGMSHAMSGAFPQARPFAENAYALAPWSAVCVGSFAGVLARSGDRTGVSTLIESLGTGEAYGAPLGLAHYYLICSDIDASAAWFEKAVEQRHPAVLFFRMAFGGALASSPRWPEIAKILNLPAEMKAAPKLSRAESI